MRKPQDRGSESFVGLCLESVLRRSLHLPRTKVEVLWRTQSQLDRLLLVHRLSGTYLTIRSVVRGRPRGNICLNRTKESRDRGTEVRRTSKVTGIDRVQNDRPQYLTLTSFLLTVRTPRCKYGRWRLTGLHWRNSRTDGPKHCSIIVSLRPHQISGPNTSLRWKVLRWRPEHLTVRVVVRQKWQERWKI